MLQTISRLLQILLVFSMWQTNKYSGSSDAVQNILYVVPGGHMFNCKWTFTSSNPHRSKTFPTFLKTEANLDVQQGCKYVPESDKKKIQKKDLDIA